MKVIFVIALWTAATLRVNGENRTTMDLMIRKLSDTTILPFIFEGAEFLREPDISQSCKDSLKVFRDSIYAKEPWAITMLDASGKMASNLASGRRTFAGSHRECSGVTTSQQWSSKLCTASLIFNLVLENATTAWLNNVFNFDVCVPSFCSEKDLFLANNRGLKNLNINGFPFNCYAEKESLEPQQIAAIVILSMVAVVVVIGTLVDLIRRSVSGKSRDADSETSAKGPAPKGKLETGLTAFSLYTNALAVLNTECPGASLTALNGIRFLSTTWIILYHTCYQTNGIAANTKDYSDNRFHFAYQIVLNGLISVDTFFFIGGLLVAYVNLRKLKKATIFTWWDYFQLVVHRYWRLTPPVLLAILFTFVWPLLGSGPNWVTSTNPDYQGCTSNWFSNLLYFNNFYGLQLPCLDHLWYLADDMQFYLISPAIFYLLYKYPKRGIALNSAVLLASIVISFTLGVVYDLQATTLFYLDSRKIFDGYQKVYTKPYTRIGPYCLGIFVGYLLATRNRATLKPGVQVFGWCLSFVCCFSTVYGVYSWNKGIYGNLYVNALYLALHRSVWSLGIAWLCYACATGYGGIVNRILSWKAFVPLSKLTYIAYIIHPFVVKALVGIQSEKIVLNMYLWVIMYVGIVAVSFGLAFPISLCAEVPFVSLEKLVFPCFHRKKSSPGPSDPISIISPPNYSSMGRDNEAFTIEASENSSRASENVLGAEKLL